MSDVIAETAADIREMKVRGAGRIARAGASALVSFAEKYDGNDREAFLRDLRKAEETILGSRPTAVSLWNGVNYTVRNASGAATFDEARQVVIDDGNAFVSSSKMAVETIARIGARRIQDGDVVLTHCNSSSAIGIIAEAVRQGKDIKVFATESRPWRQGILSVRDLAEAGADTTLIIDSAVRTVMKQVDRVFVGADTITSSGDLVNKVGTSQVALCAHEARSEFNVCSETYKFSPKTLFGETVPIEERDIGEVVRPGEIPASVKVFNPVFDITPARYIDNIITESGVISPGSVYSVMATQLGDRVNGPEI